MMRSCRSFILFIVIFCFTSCFTGKEYHHSRVQVKPVERSESYSEKPNQQYLKDSLILVGRKISAERDHPLKEKKRFRKVTAPTKQNVYTQSRSSFKIPSDHKPLKRTFKVEETNESLLGTLGLVIAFLSGIIGLVLVIVGFILGMFGILIGFWIAWALGLGGLIFALIVSIIVSTGGYDDIASGVSIIIYSLLLILAIVFLLIVLL